MQLSKICQENVSASPPLIIDASSIDLSEYRPETIMTSIANIENSTNFNSIPGTYDNNSNYSIGPYFDEKLTEYLGSAR